MVLGDLVAGRRFPLTELARCLSSSWCDIGVSKCELSRWSAVSEERRRGIGTRTEVAP